MMRQIYITANGALDATGWRAASLTSRTLPGRIRFANVLSPDLPTRAGRFLGRRRAADDQGSGLEGRDGRRRVPERRPSEHDHGDIPDHEPEVRPSRRPRISRLPSLSMIYAKKPKFPARVYASKVPKLAIFICEMPLPMGTHRPVAYTLLKWAKDHGCRQIVPLEGLPAVADLALSGHKQVWGVGV